MTSLDGFKEIVFSFKMLVAYCLWLVAFGLWLAALQQAGCSSELSICAKFKVKSEKFCRRHLFGKKWKVKSSKTHLSLSINHF